MSSTKEFIDCPHCGKRVLSSARTCHRCRQPLASSSVGSSGATPGVRPYSTHEEDEVDPESQAHMASEAGYTDEYNDDDYREFVETELENKPFRLQTWSWVSLVAIFLIIWLLYLAVS